MGAPRARRSLFKRRRRADNDEGEEEGSVGPGVEDDSLSEASAVSDADEDADGEGSDRSDLGSPVTKDSEAGAVANGHRDGTQIPLQVNTSDPRKQPLASTSSDMETMMNGLKVSEGPEEEAEEVKFEDMADGDAATGPMSQTVGTPADKSRREHEEYKKRRDADPAFVPNRGVFFMHDHRSSAPGQNGFRPFGRGRGRGRGGGPIQGFDQSQPGSADAPWAHDLHDSLGQETTAPIQQTIQERRGPPVAALKTPLPNRTFSGSRHVGNVQIRVLMNGMSDPIVFSAVPVNQHTRLPHHRPPLRRDKPVRISLPESPIRYIFPATERSFIFIPRALRPNQQGFGRARGRGSFGGGYGSFGPMSSRRTSVYAGSGYTPSVAMSRRSSLAREIVLDGVASPGGQQFPRQPGIALEAGKPVVRLPPGVEQGPINVPPQTYDQAAPTVNLPHPSAYPLPPKPVVGEVRPDSVPMHHPKPERTLQVGDIDSPATLEFNPPQPQQQQPFHQQVPQLASYQPDPSQYPHSRHPSHPSQVGTPLQNIPESVIHAQPFQPYAFAQQQGFYSQPYHPAMYFYPPAPPAGSSPAAAAPPFVPGQPFFYPMPMGPPTQPAAPDQSGSNQMVAHETGGMVYYYNPAELAQSNENNVQFGQNGYGAGPAPMGMGSDMMPYYAAPTVFYPQAPPPAQQP